MIKTELYFGQAIGEHTGQTYTDIAEDVNFDSFMRFVDQDITPRFPDGITILDAVGQYQMPHPSDSVRERTKIVVLLHENKRENYQKIYNIIAKYKSQFKQEPVLWVDSEVEVTF